MRSELVLLTYFTQAHIKNCFLCLLIMIFEVLFTIVDFHMADLIHSVRVPILHSVDIVSNLLYL